jgi:hypothetical protein
VQLQPEGSENPCSVAALLATATFLAGLVASPMRSFVLNLLVKFGQLLLLHLQAPCPVILAVTDILARDSNVASP